MGRQRATGFFYILNVIRFQGSPAKVETTIKNTASQDGRKCRIRIPEDPGQAGKAQAAGARSDARRLCGQGGAPTGSKEARATPLSAQVEAGNVKLVKGDWNEPFLQEIELFPFGKHDDQVDAAADAFNELAAGSKGSAGSRRSMRIWRAKSWKSSARRSPSTSITSATPGGCRCRSRCSTRIGSRSGLELRQDMREAGLVDEDDGGIG
jgi:predicted phage terminase large subunit-like protein